MDLQTGFVDLELGKFENRNAALGIHGYKPGLRIYEFANRCCGFINLESCRKYASTAWIYGFANRISWFMYLWTGFVNSYICEFRITSWCNRSAIEFADLQIGCLDSCICESELWIHKFVNLALLVIVIVIQLDLRIRISDFWIRGFVYRMCGFVNLWIRRAWWTSL